MRDRLIELLIKSGVTWNPCGVADSLLDNGIIVPPIPLRVGDTVYRKMCRGFRDFFIREETVWIVDMHFNAGLEIITKYVEPKGYTYFPKLNIDDIGKTIFLTREQAEKALAEVANDA